MNSDEEIKEAFAVFGAACCSSALDDGWCLVLVRSLTVHLTAMDMDYAINSFVHA